MWPFKKAKRWIVMRVESPGGYYAGVQVGIDSMWTPFKEEAMLFTDMEAFRMKIKLTQLGIASVELET